MYLPRKDFNCVGVVYDTYQIGNRSGVSIILEDGRYNGWSITDWLAVRGQHLASGYINYTFTSVITLAQDYDRGRFRDLFLKANALRKIRSA